MDSTTRSALRVATAPRRPDHAGRRRHVRRRPPRRLEPESRPTSEPHHLAHNCLLLERDRQPAPAPRRVLIETGSGNKFGPKMRNIFGLTDYAIVDASRRSGRRDARKSTM